MILNMTWNDWIILQQRAPEWYEFAAQIAIQKKRKKKAEEKETLWGCQTVASLSSVSVQNKVVAPDVISLTQNAAKKSCYTYQRCIIYFACMWWLSPLHCLPAAFVHPLLYLFCYLGIHYIFTFLRQKNPLNISEAGGCLPWSNIALQLFLYASWGFISDALSDFKRQMHKRTCSLCICGNVLSICLKHVHVFVLTNESRKTSCD